MGELERKLLKEFFGFTVDSLSSTSSMLARVIHEARKEFPDYLMFDSDYSKNDPYITHQKWTLDEKNRFLKTERDKWFKKWFGESED